MLEVFTDQSPMPFGQYKGQPLVAVPASHLIWLYDNERAGRIKSYIKENMDVLQKQAAKERRKRR